jgi:hypothetical protein
VGDLVTDLLVELLDELEARDASESVGPGAESVRIEIYAAAGTAKWDSAHWDGDTWSVASWQYVSCQVVEADYQSGVSQEAGILSVPDAGALDLRTYDPDRILDPLATSSPIFGAVRPGTPIRITNAQGNAAWQGFIDEARYELATATGRIRGVDGIALLAQAEVPDATVLPNTLRARVRAVINAVGLGTIIPVAPDTTSGEFLTNGSFELVDNPAAEYAQPSAWGMYPDATGMSSHLYPGITTDGVRFLEGVWSDGTGRVAYQLVDGLIPGQTYVASVNARRSGGVSYLWARDPDNGYNVVAQIDLGTSANLARVQMFFNGPAGGRIQIEVGGSGPVGAGSWFNADTVSLYGPMATQPADPPVAAFDGKAASAWSIIQAAGLDALTFVWLGPAGQIRFTAWGSLPDADYAVGCDDGLGGVWLEGLASLETIAQADSIRNAVRWYSSGTTWAAPLKDAVSVARYGERRLDVARIVPNAAVWAQRILDDRADSGLEVTLGELRPYTDAELLTLLNGAYNGPAALRVRDDAHGELVDVTVAVLGQSVGITAGGWRFRQVTMIPRTEWVEVPPAPVTPPTPPAGTYHTETRTYVATSDALIALTSGGSKYGAGAATSLPVGVWSGWTYRALIQFPAIPWTKVRRIVSATLDLATSTQVRVGFGSSPTVEAKRITGSWSAGTASSPSSGNAVVWPGPAVTGSVYANVSKSQNATVRFRVDGLVLPWAPIGIGGTGAAQRGLALYPGSGSTADTSEFWPVEASGTASDPTLELVLEVYD